MIWELIWITREYVMLAAAKLRRRIRPAGWGPTRQG